MKYGLSAFTQVSNFLSASGLGLILCILYYSLAFIRSAISKKTLSYIISDTVFSVLTGFLIFVFFEVCTYGEIRIELLVSAAVSFFVFRYCFKELFSVPFRKGTHLLSLFFKAFFAPFTVLSFVFKKSLKNFIKKEK